MTELASHIVDHVIPAVAVRQWVLSLPHRLRYRLAYDHARMVSVFRIFVRAVMGLYERRARELGWRGGKTGTISFVQRFGSAANLHVHAHVLVMDGVFTEEADGQLQFRKVPAPSDRELERLLVTVRRRVVRHLHQQGWLDEGDGDTDPVADAGPVLAACYRGAVASRQTLGGRPGARLARVGADGRTGWVERPVGPLQARVDGFDLHARLAIAADGRGGTTRLEKLVRYCARPPISNDRISLRADGQVQLELKTPWSDVYASYCTSYRS